MLPFEKDNKRKWQCFVCGMTHTNFEDFKTHVAENHEEGREYIVCPLPHCQAPVRDLKLHFKSIHPSAPIPKNSQFKATIWKDQGKKGNKLKQRKPNFREGYLTSNKNGGKEMHYRSGYECDVYKCLESLQEVIAYDVEPFSVPYSFNGEAHHYHPDIKIVYDDGRTEIWEIKPSKQTHLPVNSAKWSAAQDYCEARGWEFLVITEKGIDKLKQRVRGQI